MAHIREIISDTQFGVLLIILPCLLLPSSCESRISEANDSQKSPVVENSETLIPQQELHDTEIEEDPKTEVEVFEYENITTHPDLKVEITANIKPRVDKSSNDVPSELGFFMPTSGAFTTQKPESQLVASATVVEHSQLRERTPKVLEVNDTISFEGASALWDDVIDQLGLSASEANSKVVLNDKITTMRPSTFSRGNQKTKAALLEKKRKLAELRALVQESRQFRPPIRVELINHGARPLKPPRHPLSDTHQTSGETDPAGSQDGKGSSETAGASDSQLVIESESEEDFSGATGKEGARNDMNRDKAVNASLAKVEETREQLRGTREILQTNLEHASVSSPLLVPIGETYVPPPLSHHGHHGGRPEIFQQHHNLLSEHPRPFEVSGPFDIPVGSLGVSKAHGSYGVPKPSKSYGLPKPSKSYGAPPPLSSGLGIPPPLSPGHGIPPSHGHGRLPSKTYGPPPQHSYYGHPYIGETYYEVVEEYPSFSNLLNEIKFFGYTIPELKAAKIEFLKKLFGYGKAQEYATEIYLPPEIASVDTVKKGYSGMTPAQVLHYHTHSHSHKHIHKYYGGKKNRYGKSYGTLDHIHYPGPLIGPIIGFNNLQSKKPSGLTYVMQQFLKGFFGNIFAQRK
ncbi:unnamed protein product [Cyprideis torosa]|uniref:Uncharacterized protein n=1 Tax=Cyprideis torosa TaxID=163714 RepID=A0A7R8W4P2_9CRUS|nr:unnamed protein product [Cyprideis torosa]CAG0884395.1 unnamed protein product [Cyprideis torosa]